MLSMHLKEKYKSPGLDIFGLDPPGLETIGIAINF
jgi:hypothetical protein